MPRTDSARRDIAAAPGEVFAALVDPEALVAWLPPAGMSGRFEHFDARPGGTYRMVLTYDDPTVAGKSGGGDDVVEVRADDVPDGISAQDHADGMASSLAKLAQFTESRRA